MDVLYVDGGEHVPSAPVAARSNPYSEIDSALDPFAAAGTDELIGGAVPTRDRGNDTADARTDAILALVRDQKTDIDIVTKRPIIQLRRRSKMPFKLRVLTFALLFGSILFAYLLDFFAGGAVFATLNSWSDSIVESAIHGFCATAADITGSDWSGRELALYRLMTLGPVSFSVLAFAFSLLITGIIAIIWSAKATKASEDDGTNNFLAESRKDARVAAAEKAIIIAKKQAAKAGESDSDLNAKAAGAKPSGTPRKTEATGAA